MSIFKPRFLSYGKSDRAELGTGNLNFSRAFFMIFLNFFGRPPWATFLEISVDLLIYLSDSIFKLCSRNIAKMEKSKWSEKNRMIGPYFCRYWQLSSYSLLFSDLKILAEKRNGNLEAIVMTEVVVLDSNGMEVPIDHIIELFPKADLYSL